MELMVAQQCCGSWQEQCCSGAARQGVPSRQPVIGGNSRQKLPW